MSRLRRKWEPFRCADCDVNVGEIREYAYAVHSSIWEKSGAGDGSSTYLCVGCLENRLGRELVPDDFDMVAINNRRPAQQSERLQSRIRYTLGS